MSLAEISGIFRDGLFTIPEKFFQCPKQLYAIGLCHEYYSLYELVSVSWLSSVFIGLYWREQEGKGACSSIFQASSAGTWTYRQKYAIRQRGESDFVPNLILCNSLVIHIYWLSCCEFAAAHVKAEFSNEVLVSLDLRWTTYMIQFIADSVNLCTQFEVINLDANMYCLLPIQIVSNILSIIRHAVAEDHVKQDRLN